MLLAVSSMACAEQPGQNAVSELYSADGFYVDGVGNSSSYSYHVPQISSSTPEAEKINSEIAEKFGTVVEDQFRSMEGGYSLWAWHVGWQAFWNDTQLFLLLTADEDSDITIYDAYGYDFDSDCRVTDKMILEQRGICRNEYKEKLKEKAQLLVEEYYSRIPETHRDQSVYDEMLDSTLGWLDRDQPMFINEYGDIVTIVKVATIAGAGWCYRFAEPFSDVPDGAHAIRISGDVDLVESCPSSAKAGDSVMVRIYDVTDGDVEIEAVDAEGMRIDWQEYGFVMPDHEVEVRVEFIDYGLA